MTVEAGVILPYFSTNATVPSEFPRDNDFNGRFLLGCSSADSAGGTLSGSENHGHNKLAHIHNVSGGASSGESKATVGITQASESRHLHAEKASSAESNDWSWSLVDNLPYYYEVIFCTSDGTRDVPPNMGCLSETTTLGKLTEKTETRSRMLRGAPTSGNAGGTGGSVKHKHNSTGVHPHPNLTSNRDVTRNYSGAGRGLIVPHDHVLSFSNESMTTGYASSFPPYRTLASLYNNTIGDVRLRTGAIALFKGVRSAIPEYWTEYILQRDLFLCIWNGLGSIVAIKGDEEHEHDGVAHKHTMTIVSVSGAELASNPLGFTACATLAHTHEWTCSNATVGAVITTGHATYPLYIKVFFIQYTEPANLRWFHRWHREVSLGVYV